MIPTTEEVIQQAESFKATLADALWLIDNEQAIRDMLPETWTHLSNVDGKALRLAMAKILKTDELYPEVVTCFMQYFEALGMVLRKNGYLIRRNDATIYPELKDLLDKLDS